MGRGLTTAEKNYSGPLWWALELTLRSGAVKQFSEAELFFGGQQFEPYLRPPGSVRLYLDPEALDEASLVLSNADGRLGAMIEAETFRDAKATLRQILLGLDSSVIVLSGRVVELGDVLDEVPLRILADWPLGQIAVERRLAGSLCSHRFADGGCGYDHDNISWLVNLAERTATSVGDQDIADSALAETVDAHKDRWVFVREATAGRGQIRRIRTNTATTFTFYEPWVTKPTGTVKFEIVTYTNGAPAPLLTSTTARMERTATGGAATYIEDIALAMTVDEHARRWVRITAGTGSGQRKRIASNTATRLTLESGQTFAPAPDATSVFRVLFDKCNLDLFDNCEARARTHEFSGFPTLTQLVRQQNRAGEEIEHQDLNFRG